MNDARNNVVLRNSWNVVLCILFDNKHGKHQMQNQPQQNRSTNINFMGTALSIAHTRLWIICVFIHIYIFRVCVYLICIIEQLEIERNSQKDVWNENHKNYYSPHSKSTDRERRRVRREKGLKWRKIRNFYSSLAFIKMRKSDLFTLWIKFCCDLWIELGRRRRRRVKRILKLREINPFVISLLKSLN